MDVVFKSMRQRLGIEVKQSAIHVHQ
jgi:hypothetical protein